MARRSSHVWHLTAINSSETKASRKKDIVEVEEDEENNNKKRSQIEEQTRMTNHLRFANNNYRMSK